FADKYSFRSLLIRRTSLERSSANASQSLLQYRAFLRSCVKKSRADTKHRESFSSLEETSIRRQASTSSSAGGNFVMFTECSAGSSGRLCQAEQHSPHKPKSFGSDSALR